MGNTVFSCPKCGTGLGIGDAQCPGCGVKINTSAYAAYQAAPQQPTAGQNQAASSNSSVAANPANNANQGQTTPQATDFSHDFENAANQAAAKFNDVMSSQEMQQAKARANHFLGWLVASWKRPTQELNAPHMYGVVSFALQAFIVSLMQFISISSAINNQSKAVSGFLPQFGGAAHAVAGAANNFFFDVFVKMFFVTLICELIFLACSYGAYKMTHSKSISFFAYITKVAQYCNLNFLFVCIAFVCNLISLSFFSGILLCVMGPLFFIATIVVTAKDAEPAQKDIMHVSFLIMFGSFVSFVIYCIFVLSVVLAGMGSIANNLMRL
ncbi:DUF6574 domain-containing protein [Fannyhessea vaginae]|uniref:DUF6574 domain-containing protein n=1 Tax=Fannyhessea vaginae TaxID=82135 RepID=UPI0023F56AE1|nr:DUF6574 domain-containing protein [Fannyhessea vaginae]